MGEEDLRASNESVPAWYRYGVSALAALFLVPLLIGVLVPMLMVLAPVAFVGLPFLLAAFVRLPRLPRRSQTPERAAARAPAPLGAAPAF